LRARIVPLEGFGPGREKERIGLAPHGERRRPADAKYFWNCGYSLTLLA
jgi:hypothetical protein